MPSEWQSGPPAPEERTPSNLPDDLGPRDPAHLASAKPDHREDDGEWRRLHPLSPLIGVIETLASYAIPIVLLVVFSKGSSLDFLILVSVVSSTVIAVARYVSFSYRLGAEEIVVRQGILRRTVRHVPYERIQNLDRSRNLTQRVFRVSQLSLETASGGEPEAVFRCVGGEEVREIEARVTEVRSGSSGTDGRRAEIWASSLDRDAPEALTSPPESQGDNAVGPNSAPGTRATKATPEPSRTVAETMSPRGGGVGKEVPRALEEPSDSDTGSARVLHEVPLRDLLLLGLFSLRGFALFAALSGVAWQFDIFESPGVLEWMKSVPERWSQIAGMDDQFPLVVGLGVFLVLFVVTLVSILLTVVENYGFRLTDGGPELRTRVGLLTQHASTIPKGRIQILEFLSPPHLRPFHRVRVWVGTAGGQVQKTAGRSWLLPIVRTKDLDQVLSAVQPTSILPAAAWRPVHPEAARRMQRRAGLWILILTGALVWKFGLPALLTFALLPVAFVYADRTARHLGYAISADAIFARHGWIFGRTQVVSLGKVQSVSIVESPFDRRWKMATLVVDTASPTKGQLLVPYLPDTIAAELQQQLSAEASRRRFHW